MYRGMLLVCVKIERWLGILVGVVDCCFDWMNIVFLYLMV